jgi:hypothetical protein
LNNNNNQSKSSSVTVVSISLKKERDKDGLRLEQVKLISILKTFSRVVASVDD